MNLILPLPPTDNNLRSIATYLRPVQLVKTSVYRSWEKKATEAFLSWQKDGGDTFLDPSYQNQIKIPYSLILSNKRSDISNYEKALKDFLSKKIYKDDKWIKLDLNMPVIVNKSENEPQVIIYL